MPDGGRPQLFFPSIGGRKTDRLHKCHRTHPPACYARSVEPFKPECPNVSTYSRDRLDLRYMFPRMHQFVELGNMPYH